MGKTAFHLSETMQEETRMGNIFGYIRVSSRDQNEDRQLIALKELAIPEKNILLINSLEKTSSAHNTENDSTCPER